MSVPKPQELATTSQEVWLAREDHAVTGLVDVGYGALSQTDRAGWRL